MKIPKSVWIILFWIIILGGFLFYQQTRLTGGHDIWVKPQPVDPRDMFRGDYVIFTYDFSRFQKDYYTQGGYSEENTELYAILSNQTGGYYQLERFSTQPPEDMNTIFLKGRAVDGLHEGAVITYNIESYFVQEGEGKEYENLVGSDLLVNIHINTKGEATINKTNIDDLKKRSDK
jgi:uncharacterized membrane-anchored protein